MDIPDAMNTIMQSRSPKQETLAEGLVALLHHFPTDNIPDSILRRTALCFEDTIGVAIAAAGLGVGIAGAKVAAKTAAGTSTIWGFGVDVSAGEAAFANGMLAHALDFDDTHAAAIMHSSSMVVPAAISVSQRTGANARDMLAAAAIGFEVAGRLGRLSPGPFQDHGFQATSVLGVFATTAIASRLFRLTSRQSVHALGIAGSMSAGLMEYLSDGTDVKQMHAGWSAQAGIRAAELAAAGFTGPASVFEGKFGVFRSFARTDIDPADALSADLSRWEVEYMGPKPYPACLCVHPLVQAVLELQRRGHIDADHVKEIKEIHCYVPEWYVNLVFEPTQAKLNVRTPYEARFSAPFCMARALLDQSLGLLSFSSDKLSDSRLGAIASKITYSVERLPEFPAAFPARVTVEKANGEIHECYIHHNIGSPENPLSDEQYEAKFLSAAAPAIGRQSACELHQSIRSLLDPGSELRLFENLRDFRVETS